MFSQHKCSIPIQVNHNKVESLSSARAAISIVFFYCLGQEVCYHLIRSIVFFFVAYCFIQEKK